MRAGRTIRQDRTGRVLGAAMAIGLSAPAFAQDGVFRDYDALRETLDTLMNERRIAEYMIAVGGADEMTEQELAALEGRVRAIFPEPFAHVDVLRREELGGGFRHEMLVYWTGTSYLYVRMLLHDRGDRMLAVTTRFNTDFDAINGLF